MHIIINTLLFYFSLYILFITLTQYYNSYHLHNCPSMALQQQVTSPPCQNRRDSLIYPVFLICLLISLSIAGFIFCATVPSRTNLKFEVDSLIVSPFNISCSSQITSNWNIVFSAIDFEDCNIHCSNSNTYYGDVEVSVLYKGLKISSRVFKSPLFEYNRDRRKRLIHANIDVSSAYINPALADAIADDLTSSAAVNFTVAVRTVVEIEGQDFKSGLMTASCEQVKVDFSSNMTTGTMVGGSGTCITSLRRLNFWLLLTNCLFFCFFFSFNRLEEY